MKLRSLKRTAAFLLCLMLLASFSAALAVDAGALTDGGELKQEWTMDQVFTLADPAPWNLEELKQVVDVQDPRSVAAYFIWAVTRLTDSYDDGMAMMKYLFADINPYDPEGGFTEGGMSGMAGWESYFDERLTDPDYRWLPRAYFEGASPDNGFQPDRPLTVELYYNEPNTEAINSQTYEQEGRLNIVYWVMSHAAGNQVNISLSRFKGSDRWYVTSSLTSKALYYDQRSDFSADVLALAAEIPNDASTAEEHTRRYGGAPGEPETAGETPFTDVPGDCYYIDAVNWAYNTGVTTGTSDTTFDPEGSCTRGQVVTFLWRAAGEPEPASLVNPFEDVKETDYFYKAVLWAVEQGITNGTGEGEFSPHIFCSNAQIITFLFRSVTGILTPSFGTTWYEDALFWARYNGLLTDTHVDGEHGDIKAVCPRCDVVTFLYRSYEKRTFDEPHSIVPIYYSFLRINGALYEIVYSYESKDRQSNIIYQDKKTNELYMDALKPSDMWTNTVTLSVLTHTFETTIPDNPYIDGAIDLFSTFYQSSLVSISEQRYYTSATTSYSTFLHSYNGKTLEIPVAISDNTYDSIVEIDGMKYCGKYMCITDYCSYFSLKVTLDIEYDEALGEQVLIVEY